MVFYVILLVMIIVMLVYMLFFFISYKTLMNMEESSSYECGFNLLNKARMMFSYRFFLISVLFLIFDVEIVLMLCFPFLIMSVEMMMMSLLFLLVLVLGLIYEYYWGSLEWVNVSKA